MPVFIICVPRGTMMNDIYKRQHVILPQMNGEEEKKH